VWTPKGKEDAMKYNIRVIPTQVFLGKNGKEYYRHEGYFPKDDVVRVIKMQGVK
jgi:thioredoxin 1